MTIIRTDKNRRIPVIPNFKERDTVNNTDSFGDLLHEKLDMAIWWNGYLSENKKDSSKPGFTILLNLRDRSEEAIELRNNKIDELTNKTASLNETLIYTGINRQREIISKGDKKRYLNKHWAFLEQWKIQSNEAVEGGGIYEKFKNGAYSLKDINLGNLKDYFEAIIDPNSIEEVAEEQTSEYPILKEYFNIKTDHFISVPLIAFADFEGIAHIIFTHENKANAERNKGKIIQAFTMAYELLLLDWDLVSANIYKKAILPFFNEFEENTFYQRDIISKNPIMRELNYYRYYQKVAYFYKEREKQNNIVPRLLINQYIKTAIISILIDSYAHNISAHSLTTLNWWFKQRADLFKKQSNSELKEVIAALEERIAENDLIGIDDLEYLLPLVKPLLENKIVDTGKEEPDNYVVNYDDHLERELQPLLKFLLEKGAFWSGIARDNNFGGEVEDMFSVLWNDFINNPLYLGTIAKSEEISKINLQITIYDSHSNKFPPYFNIKEVVQDGILVSVDLTNKPDEDNKDGETEYAIDLGGNKLSFADNKELYQKSRFVRLGTAYRELRDALREHKLFFPGGIVGRHAFFTMLENEIRNVKHYSTKELKAIRENGGLTLNLSLQSVSVNNSKEEELYQVGIWLKTPTVLVKEKGKSEESEYLVLRKAGRMDSDIMTIGTFSPKLGGTYQDKICAAMLFNNNFASVQNGDGNINRGADNDSERDLARYPWVIAATSETNRHNDFELHKLAKYDIEDFKQQYQHKEGYLKKYFHIWKGDNIKVVNEDYDYTYENIARFKFVSCSGSLEAKQKARSEGVIRVIDKEIDTKNEEQDLELAYSDWLPKWLYDKQLIINVTVDQRIGKGVFVYNTIDCDGEDCFHYYSEEEWNKNTSLKAKYAEEEQLQFNIAHRKDNYEENAINYRSHGIFKTYFTNSESGSASFHAVPKARLIEFFEVMRTTIYIIDNRVAHRIEPLKRKEFYKKQLQLIIENEGHHTWENAKRYIPTANFVVLHLSYIEAFLKDFHSDKPDYEGNLGLFIKEEILPLKSGLENIKDNFILVITTGRGRTEWWKKLDENDEYKQYKRFTIFRPVESLISGVESAVSMKDDVELKYRLTKVLFGS